VGTGVVTTSFLDQTPAEEQRQLAERAAITGQDVTANVHRLIERDVKGSVALEEILDPVREQFESSGMTEAELDELVEEARKEIWQQKQGKTSMAKRL